MRSLQILAKASLTEKHVKVEFSLCTASLQLLFDTFPDFSVMVQSIIIIVFEALVNRHSVPLRCQPHWIQFRMSPHKQRHTLSYAAF